MKTQESKPQNHRGMVRSVVAGLGSMLTITAPNAGHYHPPTSAQNALRGDMIRLGIDMQTAIERVRRSEEARR